MKRPVVAIVQARMGSSRLPGKVLAEAAGKPLLAHMLPRIARAGLIDAIVVATSDHPRDDVIAALAELHGVPVFRGSEHDVLDRFAGAAAQAGAGTVVRLTADCPLLAPDVVDRVVAAFAQGGADLATNAPPVGRTYPKGMDVEVLARTTLDRLAATATDPADREHVTRRLHGGGYRVREVHLDRPLGDVRITVDTPEDLALVRAILAALVPGNPDFGLEDVLAWLERNRPRAL